jgi:hypothetical protein
MPGEISSGFFLGFGLGSRAGRYLDGSATHRSPDRGAQRLLSRGIVSRICARNLGRRL